MPEQIKEVESELLQKSNRTLTNFGLRRLIEKSMDCHPTLVWPLPMAPFHCHFLGVDQAALEGCKVGSVHGCVDAHANDLAWLAGKSKAIDAWVRPTFIPGGGWHTCWSQDPTIRGSYHQNLLQWALTSAACATWPLIRNRVENQDSISLPIATKEEFRRIIPTLGASSTEFADQWDRLLLGRACFKYSGYSMQSTDMFEPTVGGMDIFDPTQLMHDEQTCPSIRRHHKTTELSLNALGVLYAFGLRRRVTYIASAGLENDELMEEFQSWIWKCKEAHRRLLFHLICCPGNLQSYSGVRLQHLQQPSRLAQVFGSAVKDFRPGSIRDLTRLRDRIATELLKGAPAVFRDFLMNSFNEFIPTRNLEAVLAEVKRFNTNLGNLATGSGNPADLKEDISSHRFELSSPPTMNIHPANLGIPSHHLRQTFPSDGHYLQHDQRDLIPAEGKKKKEARRGRKNADVPSMEIEMGWFPPPLFESPSQPGPGPLEAQILAPNAANRIGVRYWFPGAQGQRQDRRWSATDRYHLPLGSRAPKSHHVSLLDSYKAFDRMVQCRPDFQDRFSADLVHLLANYLPAGEARTTTIPEIFQSLQGAAFNTDESKIHHLVAMLDTCPDILVPHKPIALREAIKHPSLLCAWEQWGNNLKFLSSLGWERFAFADPYQAHAARGWNAEESIPMHHREDCAVSFARWWVGKFIYASLDPRYEHQASVRMPMTFLVSLAGGAIHDAERLDPLRKGVEALGHKLFEYQAQTFRWNHGHTQQLIDPDILWT